MSKTRFILLAEDNPNDAELVISALEEQGLDSQVMVVNDGVEVIDFLRGSGKFSSRRKEYPAVIFLDIKMPKMTGIEALEIIKTDTLLKFIPIVMLTSSREEADLIKCYELGVNAFVVKPVDFSEFLETVERLATFWISINELP